MRSHGGTVRGEISTGVPFRDTLSGVIIRLHEMGLFLSPEEDPEGREE
jgi:hypothetical protein